MEKKITTENSIDVYYYPNRATHSFCLSLYIKAGAMYETDEDNGITHFLEHVLFRNLNHLMEGNLYKEVDRRGLYFNGATYKEFMQLYIIGAPQHFQEAAAILSKTFEPLTLSGEEIRTEQQRVKAEIREADDFKSLDYFAGTHVWAGTPLRNTILGTRGNVNHFGKQKMKQYHQEIFSQGNLFFYITGNVSEKDLDWFADLLQHVQLPKTDFARNNVAPVPANFMNRNGLTVLKQGRYTMAEFSFDFLTPRYKAAELALLYDVVASGENSLMHRELSEKRGMIYSFSAALEKYRNLGRLYFTYEISSKDLASSVAIVRDGLAGLGKDMKERLSYVLPEYVDNAYMFYDDNEGFNWQRAYENHIMGSDFGDIEATQKAYSQVSAERLCQVADEIFRPENLVLSLKGEKKRIDTEELRKILL